MENNELKEVIRNYILENKEKMYEAPEDDQEDDQEGGEKENGDNQQSKDLLDKVDAKSPELDQKLQQVSDKQAQLKVIKNTVDWIRSKMKKGIVYDKDIYNLFRDGQPSVTGEKVDEMSTTAGAPAPATKYAYKLKK